MGISRKELGMMPKNWCLQTMVLEKTPESPVDSKIKPVNLKGNQPWTLVGSTDAEVETPVFWSSDADSKLIGKVPDAGKDWVQKEKRASEDEMAAWHQQCNEHELGQTPGDGEGQGSLARCSPWGHKESDMTWWLNNDNNYPVPYTFWSTLNLKILVIFQIQILKVWHFY